VPVRSGPKVRHFSKPRETRPGLRPDRTGTVRLRPVREKRWLSFFPLTPSLDRTYSPP